MNLELLKEKGNKTSLTVTSSEVHPNKNIATLLAHDSEGKSNKSIRFNNKAIVTLNGKLNADDTTRVIMFKEYQTDVTNKDTFVPVLFATNQEVIRANNRNNRSYQVASTNKCFSTEIYDFLTELFDFDSSRDNHIELVATEDYTDGAFTFKAIVEEPVFDKGANVTIETV